MAALYGNIQSRQADLGLSIVHGCREKPVGKMAFDQTRGCQLLWKQKVSALICILPFSYQSCRNTLSASKYTIEYIFASINFAEL